MGKIRKNLVVYTVKHRGNIVYVGHGAANRPCDWTMPSRFKTLGIVTRPQVTVVKSGLTKAQALNAESRLILKHRGKHLKNKALHSTTGGLRPWNDGLKNDPRCRGGRPKGITMTRLSREKISRAMIGRAKDWMVGRAPWNKGLTKYNNLSLKRIADGMLGNTRGKRKPFNR